MGNTTGGDSLGEGRPIFDEFRRSVNIEDRRNEDNHTAVEWKNVLPAFMDIAKDLKNKIIGTGEPLPDEVAVTALSKLLGHEDIHIDPNVGETSPLDYVLYDLEHAGKITGEFVREFKRQWNGTNEKAYKEVLEHVKEK